MEMRWVLFGMEDIEETVRDVVVQWIDKMEKERRPITTDY